MKAYFKKSSDLKRQSCDESSQNQAIRLGQIRRDKTQVTETSISSQSGASAERPACSSEEQDVEMEIRNTVVPANNSSALTMTSTDDVSNSESGLKYVNDANDVTEVLHQSDIGVIKFDERGLPHLTPAVCTLWVKTGATQFQNKQGPFHSKGGRSMTKLWFKKTFLDGQVVNRSWLLYSPLHQAAYCFCCLLFPLSLSNNRSSFKSKGGFSKWKKIEKLHSHEKSENHRKAFAAWKEAERRLEHNRAIDQELQEQIEQEKSKWRNIFKRILDCIKYLATQNLAFRGHVESLTRNQNPGNFLSLVELLAKYDPTLNVHLELVKKEKMRTSNLSAATQNKFISLLASHVQNECLFENRRNKYFGIMHDSTPDVAHQEQLSQVIRYVDVDYKKKESPSQGDFCRLFATERKRCCLNSEYYLRKTGKGSVAPT